MGDPSWFHGVSLLLIVKSAWCCGTHSIVDCSILRWIVPLFRRHTREHYSYMHEAATWRLLIRKLLEINYSTDVTSFIQDESKLYLLPRYLSYWGQVLQYYISETNSPMGHRKIDPNSSC